MSLNRCEQLLFDYIEHHPEERQYWLHKVRSTSGGDLSSHHLAERLDAELWSYFIERASVVPLLREYARVEGATRTSMRNLAEYLVRLWIPSRPRERPKTDLGVEFQ